MSDKNITLIQKTPQIYKLKDVGTQNIEIDRILLRKFNLNDAEDMFNNWAADPEISRYLNWLPHKSLDETKELLNLWIKEYENEHCYRWCIVNKETNQAIGNIDVVHLFKEACGCEIAYAISRKYWGQGIMTEVLKAVINYLFEEANFNRIQARFDVDNPASCRVMQKAGLTYEGTMRQSNTKNTGYFCSCTLYSILREEWLKNKGNYLKTNFNANKSFWDLLDNLVKNSEIIIDRPKNSAHPKFKKAIYPLDYGYLKGTLSSDNEGIDVFVGSLENKSITGILCTVDILNKDSEIKMLLGCTDREMTLAHDFLNATDFFKNLLIRK